MHDERAMKHNNNTNERLHEILVPDEKSESKADISNDDAGDISTKQRLPPHKNKRNKSSALHFTHAEFFAPESIHAHEERFRTNLIFFNVVRGTPRTILDPPRHFLDTKQISEIFPTKVAPNDL